jgi:hypothetical protein
VGKPVKTVLPAFASPHVRLPLGHEPFGSELRAEVLEAEWLRFTRNDSIGVILKAFTASLGHFRASAY